MVLFLHRVSRTAFFPPRAWVLVLICLEIGLPCAVKLPCQRIHQWHLSPPSHPISKPRQQKCDGVWACEFWSLIPRSYEADGFICSKQLKSVLFGQTHRLWNKHKRRWRVWAVTSVDFTLWIDECYLELGSRGEVVTAVWAPQLQAPRVSASAWRPREDRAAHRAGTEVSRHRGSVESQTGRCQTCTTSKFKCLTALEFSPLGGEEKALIYEVSQHITAHHIPTRRCMELTFVCFNSSK